MEKDRISHVLLLYCTAIWDANFIATKYPLAEAIPVNLTLLRFILGSVLLFLLLLFTEDVKAPLKDFYRLSLLGVAGISICQFLFTHVLECTTVTGVAIIINTTPHYDGLAAFPVLHEKLCRPRLIIGAGPLFYGHRPSNTANSQCRGLRQCLSDKRVLFLSFLWLYRPFRAVLPACFCR